MHDVVADRALHQTGRREGRLLAHQRRRMLSPAVEIAKFTRRRDRQHGPQALAHQARLLGAPAAAELHHVLAVGALAAVRPRAGLALFAPGASSPRTGGRLRRGVGGGAFLQGRSDDLSLGYAQLFALGDRQGGRRR